MMESEGKMTTTDARGWIAALIKAMHEETSGSWPDPEYKDEVYSALEMAIRTLENHDIFMKRAYSQGKQDTLSQEPCDDAISRDAVLNAICDYVALGEFADKSHTFTVRPLEKRIDALPSVTQKSKIGHCKECKYFEYDSVAKVDGVPLIVAHEICSKWGDGCKTKEDGYCFLFEPQESEG